MQGNKKLSWNRIHRKLFKLLFSVIFMMLYHNQTFKADVFVNFAVAFCMFLNIGIWSNHTYYVGSSKNLHIVYKVLNDIALKYFLHDAKVVLWKSHSFTHHFVNEGCIL